MKGHSKKGQKSYPIMGYEQSKAKYGTKKPILYWVWLVFIAVIPLAVGFLIGYSISSKNYNNGQLIQPSWAPPSWLFAPAWSVLYALMGISSALVWHYGNGLTSETCNAFLYYVLQLSLNFIWTPLFFAEGYLAGALIVIAAMWAFIVAAMTSFFRISKIATLLLVPYICWTSYATALNYAVVYLNGPVYIPINTTTSNPLPLTTTST